MSRRLRSQILSRICRWRHHNIKWGRSWVGYDPALTPGDLEATIRMRRCLCKTVYHLEEIQWGDGEVT